MVSCALFCYFSFYECKFYLCSRTIMRMAVQLPHYYSSFSMKPCFASIFFFAHHHKSQLAVSFACFVKKLKESVMSKLSFTIFS